MFPANILTSNGQTNRKLKKLALSINNSLNINNPDLLIIDQKTGWGIEQIRIIKKFVQQKPIRYNNKLIIIKKAENLKKEAQNALLKTLEEPPANTHIILATNNSSFLLPTIHSRCHHINLDRNKIQATFTSASKISVSSSLKENLSYSEKLSKNKEAVLPLLEKQLQIYQQLLLTEQPNILTANIIKNLLKSISMIKHNVDPHSALDHFFLSSC
ncbi:hypothetical protein KKE45_02625 [Patescibacteria group bacterium]|nr:hypothetical protein [Patescibacteria group bacterium]